ncbi:MAG: hypothetical protein HWD58_08310 [Bacteroidota bacterium]|nr:MAG: hypothetical protein HWD58_08310 [Bacteroidota bacterium]
MWDAINQVWKKLTRNFYTYNQDSVASVSTSKPNWQDVWTSTNRVLYTYSGSPMLKSEDLYQKWDTTNLSGYRSPARSTPTPPHRDSISSKNKSGWVRPGWIKTKKASLQCQ